MVNFPGRNGRRRRVLNEEVLAASGSRAAIQNAAAEQPTYQPMRYSEAAGVENHPQITDFVPRRYRSIAMLIVVGLASTAALAALHHVAPGLAAAIGVERVPPIDLASSGSLAAWVAAVVLLAASAHCLMIYLLRRHRIDDYRGRYRVWLSAAAACLILSANSVAGLHYLLAHTLSHVTGWTALRGGAVWWLAVGGLPLAWIAFRALRDVLECRLAAVLWFAAVGCYAAATACYLQWTTVSSPQIESMLDGALKLFGHWLLLATVVSYARFVVLDAQGLIPMTAKARQPDKAKPAPQPKRITAAPALAVHTLPQQRAEQIARSESADRGAWVDGRRPEPDDYDDESDSPNFQSKLSKAERKRLRKLKAQNRAA